MANLDQVKAQIRFQLDQLAGRNKHHDFEEIARLIVRERICSNVLPATGPVSAGGDQGRDFETFSTHLKRDPEAKTAFLRLISDAPLAFACTIERKKGLAAKVKKDVSKIISEGGKVAGVHFFGADELPVAKRHDLQKWARKEHDIALEIYDRLAIADFLSDRDLFWVAEKYLDIPNEIYPPASEVEGDHWYPKLLEEWRQKSEKYYNHSEFVELKRGVRAAYGDERFKSDLSFWLRQFEDLILHAQSNKLRRRAQFEFLWSQLQGFGSLSGLEGTLRSFTSDAIESRDAVDLENAVALHASSIRGCVEGELDLTHEELEENQVRLEQTIAAELEAESETGRRCLLLDVQSAVVFIAGYIDGDIEKGIDNSIERMLDVARLAKEAPLFPVTKLAKRLSKHIDVYGSHPKFDELTGRVDRLVAKRSGAAAAATSCRDRAIRLFQVGQILRAIDQLHKAKVDWFAEETLRGSLLTILTISHWYSHLGLDFAAKYYALSSASLAFSASDDSLKDIVPAAIGYAANIDYKIGAWAGMLTLIETNLGVLSMHSDSDLYFSDEHDRIIGHLALMLVAAERLAPHLVPTLGTLFQRWHLDEDVEELARLARVPWDGQPVASLWEAIDSQLSGTPFSDVGEFRVAQWSALGITWVLEWKNDAAMTAVAEGFAAVLQIFLADLATEELCLLCTVVCIRIEFTEMEKLSVVRRPSNVETVWDLRLPFVRPTGGKGLRDSQRMALGVAGAILREHSLLSDEDFGSALSRSFEKGLQMKVFVGKPYEQLFHEILDFEFLGELQVQGPSPGADREFPVAPPHQELAWRESLGPGYSERAALERIQQRYEGALPPVRHTLKRLNADLTFKEAILHLRAEGWLDWHLLMTVANIAINERLQGQLKLTNQRDYLLMGKLANRAMRRPEEESDSPLPPSLFSEQRLRQQLNISILSLLDSFGLEIRQETPNFEAVQELLERRFNILIDDVLHDDPFSCA